MICVWIQYCPILANQELQNFFSKYIMIMSFLFYFFSITNFPTDCLSIKKVHVIRSNMTILITL